ncbi:hypothetical protein A2U01_0109917, partial [Trifolium medium]|nr:hypothetical protein [Trifolium medium]
MAGGRAFHRCDLDICCLANVPFVEAALDTYDPE